MRYLLIISLCFHVMSVATLAQNDPDAASPSPNNSQPLYPPSRAIQLYQPREGGAHHCLHNHLIRTLQGVSKLQCAADCVRRGNVCRSVNIIGSNTHGQDGQRDVVCQLNWSTSKESPQDFKYDSTCQYFEVSWVRGCFGNCEGGQNKQRGNGGDGGDVGGGVDGADGEGVEGTSGGGGVDSHSPPPDWSDSESSDA